jgi:elongation factor Ts
MAEITASLVKELRERTGAGMMDCKKALTEANGDIELAIENMRKSGAIKAAKKAGNVAADGVIITKIDGTYGIILEVNCQTDFVAKDGGFQAFANKVLDAAVAGKITDVEVLKAQFEEERVALVAKIGENINIRRVLWKATFWVLTSTVRVSVFWLRLKALTKSWLNSWQCTSLQASQNSLSRKTCLLKW